MSISQDPSRAEFKYLIERQCEEIRTINEVSRLLRKSNQPQELVRLVANYLQQTFPLALFGVLLPEQKTLQLIQFVRIAQADMEKAVQELTPLQPQELTQLLEDASAKPGQWTPAGAVYLRSSHFIPLMFNNQPVGRLGLFTPKEVGFSEGDRHVLGIVADRLGVALHNALLLEELRLADRMKNDLMAILSHELRIPLTAIQEGSGLLLEGVLGPLNDEQKDFLSTVLGNSHRLQKLIEKVELAAQLITGKISYRMEPVDLGGLLKELEANFQPMAKTKEVELSLQGPGKPAPFTADKERLAEALGQIIENALQATPAQGTVVVQAAEIPQGWEVSVTDTGKRIPPEEIPKQFDQFFQVGGTSDRKTGGLGLGLFMASKILAGHGGSLKLESQVGRGTKVILQFPKEPPVPA